MTAQSIGALASNIVDRWAYWREELAFPGCNERDVPHDNICGYYRIKGAATKPDYPVGIYPEDGTDQIVIKVGRRDAVDMKSEQGWDFRGSGWLKCSAVEYEEYCMAVEGGVWGDGKPARKQDASAAPEPAPEDEPAAGIGHNSGDDDPFVNLKTLLLGDVETADDLLKTPVKTKDQADAISAWIVKIRDHGKNAENHRKVEKQPHLDAGRAVDAKWAELTGLSDDKMKALKKHLQPYLLEQARLEEERQHKAREEAERLRREAEERRRREEEAAAEALAKTDVASLPTDFARASAEELAAQEREREEKRKAEEAAIREAEREARAQSVNVGRTGAKTTLRKEKIGVVDDYEKAALALVRMKHSDMLATIDQLANRAAKSGMSFDGMHADVREVV